MDAGGPGTSPRCHWLTITKTTITRQPCEHPWIVQVGNKGQGNRGKKGERRQPLSKTVLSPVQGKLGTLRTTDADQHCACLKGGREEERGKPFPPRENAFHRIQLVREAPGRKEGRARGGEEEGTEPTWDLGPHCACTPGHPSCSTHATRVSLTATSF